jgi:hypothetical protein
MDCQKGKMNGMCCCNCALRFELHDHSKFPWSKREGWVCLGDAYDKPRIAFAGDFEHGMCELYTHIRRT